MSPRRLKSSILIAVILASALTLIAWTQTWFLVTLVPDEIGGADVVIGGDVAAGALAALGLAGLALAGALAIAGPVFRVVLGILEILIGATVTLSTALAIADPVHAAAAAVTGATAVSGNQSVADLVQSVGITFWPWAAVALGIAGVVLGGAILATNRRWPGFSRKYQAVRFESTDGAQLDIADLSAEPVRDSDSVADWDALSDGSDPTSR